MNKVEKLHATKLFGMAEAFRGQLDTPAASALTNASALWVDQGSGERTVERRLRAAKMKEHGVMEDINYQHSLQLDRKR